MPTENPRDTWCTPKWLFDHLNERWRFTVDAAADHDNALVAHYWTLEDDALKQSWKGKQVFCNPPFSRGNDIQAWLEKGCEAKSAVFILPARTDVEWFGYALRTAIAIVFIGGRIQFVPPANVTASSNFERTMLVVYRNQSMSQEFTFGAEVSYMRREELGYA